MFVLNNLSKVDGNLIPEDCPICGIIFIALLIAVIIAFIYAIIITIFDI